MINLYYAFLLFSIGIYFFTDNNYFYTISNDDFVKLLKDNSTIYKTDDNLCLFDYTNFLGNSYYSCAKYVEPITQKINISANQVITKSLDAYGDIFSIKTIFILFTIYTVSRLIFNYKKVSFGIDSSEIAVKKYDDIIQKSVLNCIKTVLQYIFILLHSWITLLPVGP